jgi:hypothetical protein
MKKYIVTLLMIVAAPTLVWADAYTLTVEGLVCDFCAKVLKKNSTKNLRIKKSKTFMLI